MSTPISWMKILGMIVFSGSLALECIAQELVDHILSYMHALKDTHDLYDMFHIVWSNRTFINFRILTEYNFNFIHSIPHIFSTICIRPHVLEWIIKQGGWVSIGRAYIMVEQKKQNDPVKKSFL